MRHHFYISTIQEDLLHIRVSSQTVTKSNTVVLSYTIPKSFIEILLSRGSIGKQKWLKMNCYIHVKTQLFPITSGMLVADTLRTSAFRYLPKVTIKFEADHTLINGAYWRETCYALIQWEKQERCQSGLQDSASRSRYHSMVCRNRHGKWSVWRVRITIFLFNFSSPEFFLLN